MSPKPNKNSRLVYSTDQGRICPDCSQPTDDCRCKGLGKLKSLLGDSAETPDPKKPVIISFETKGRKGKGVTCLRSLPVPAEELKTTLKSLKTLCGSGGTLKEGSIEIQGDHRVRICEWITKQGWVFKKSGG